MWKKRSFLLLLIIAIILCACAAAGGSANSPAGSTEAGAEPGSEEADYTDEYAADQGAIEEGLLRLGVTGGMIDTMDIHKTPSEYMVPLNIYERLFEVRLNDDGTTRLVPELATDYTVSKEGLVYDFTLRDDAFFSDGTKVKASDVVFTFTRMLALPDSCQTDFADAILGAEDVMSHKTDKLKGIQAVDDTHLRITLEEPFAGYIYLLATPACSILSEKCVKEAGDDFGTVPEKTIGSGPYKVTVFDKYKICLEQNPFYQGDPLTVKKAELLYLEPALVDQAFQSGSIDILDTRYIHPETVRQTYKSDLWKDHLTSASCVDVQYLMMNMDVYPFTDLRVRKAVQMAINRQRLLDELYDGEGTTLDGIYPRGLIGYCEENQGWLKYDPEKAAELIREAGVDDSTCIELAASSSDSIRELNILNMIRDDLKAVGLNATVVSYDSEGRAYLRNQGKLMAYKDSWSADANDPDNFIYYFFGSREKTAHRSSNFADEKVIARIAAARTIQDEEQRLAEYAALEKILVQDEAVWVPLFSTNHLYVLGDRVESFTPYWAGWSSMSFKDVILK